MLYVTNLAQICFSEYKYHTFFTHFLFFYLRFIRNIKKVLSLNSRQYTPPPVNKHMVPEKTQNISFVSSESVWSIPVKEESLCLYLIQSLQELGRVYPQQICTVCFGGITSFFTFRPASGCKPYTH